MSSDPLRPYLNHTEIILRIPGKPDLQLGWEDINYNMTPNGWKPIFNKEKYKKIMIERSLMNPEDDINFIFQSGRPNNKFIITRLVKQPEIQIPVTKITAEGEKKMGNGPSRGHCNTCEIAAHLINPTDASVNRTKWLNWKPHSWIECEFSDFFTLTKYLLQSAPETPGRDPQKWELLGRTVDNEWILLDEKKTADNIFNSERLKWVSININDKPPVNAIRLDIKTNMQNSEFIQLSRLRFFGIPLLLNNTAENLSSKKEKTTSSNIGIQSNLPLVINTGVQANNRAVSRNASAQANNRAVSRNASAQGNNRHILGSLINVRSKLIDHLRIAAPEELHNIERYLESRGSFRPSTEGLPRASQLSLPFSSKVRPSTVGAAGGSNLANLKLRSLGGIGNQRPASARNITNRRKVGTLLASLGNENEVNLPGSVRNGGGGGGGGYRLPPLKTRSESKEEERPQSAGILGRLKFFGSGSVKEQSVSLKLGHELLKAINEGNSEKALSLISQGADINIIGMNGYNPLLLSLEKKLPDVAEKLLDLGAIVGEGEMRYKILVASKGTPLMQKMLSKKRKNRRNRTRKN